MAQRLVRNNCQACGEPVSLNAEQVQSLGVPMPLIPGGAKMQKGKGCVKCRNTGYKGRSGVFEMFNVSREIRSLIAESAGGDAIEKLAVAQGMRRLREAAVVKLARGQTTFEEVVRMTSES
jgi:general secretion pathway protein E